MSRLGYPLALLTLMFLPKVGAAAREDPPFSPPVDAARMALYTNAELGFTVRYPIEFKAQTPQNLFTVMREGHKDVFGSDPDQNIEHQEAERCMHPLLYATSTTTVLGPGKDPVPADSRNTEGSPDSILVMDVDRTCIPGNIKGDKALTQLTGTVLHLPNITQLVPQMWFQGGGGRHVHSGMAGGMITPPSSAHSAETSAAATTNGMPFYIAASSFEQKNHWLFVVYLNGTRPDMHKTFVFTSVSFEGGRDVLLFPYLLGHVNMTK